MTNPIALIVGLGNPGPEYNNTRHNAGAWLVQALADSYQQSLRVENKFHGHIARIEIGAQRCHLLIPSTYMNHSGQAVLAMALFYKIPPQQILIAHDELDFLPGTVRLKQGGGHGGHNGLRDIIARLHSPDFLRLRIGIGQPKHRDQVIDYVLKTPSRSDRQSIEQSIDDALQVIPDVISGHVQHAIKTLHTEEAGG